MILSKDLLTDKAIELGFMDIGIAECKSLDMEFNVFEKWLEKDHQATMNWMTKNTFKRKDPKNVLPDCKSIIVVSYNYFTGENYPENLNNKGKISRYAWGTDYHEIILPKLFELEKIIKEADENANCRSYVDTGPILEKIWAEKAGIGWQGKNSLIISKKHGSYFFLGIILTTAEFEYDKPYKDYCASCTKCIQACPTDAIIDDKIIDSNKCLSFWTIEAKAHLNIPKNIADNNKNWIFGCDICQEVCPWNKNLPKPTGEIAFYPRNEETAIEIGKLMEMNKMDFAERFRKSPIKRTKLEGMQRNAKQLKFTESNIE
jgi:epoxyqueuosine reductase